jgi:concentrative nucleoside transporter, CNT family
MAVGMLLAANEVGAGVSILNLVSFLGLILLVFMAWLMSSHRDRVDWRMVLTGVALQIVIAMLLFNSQSWTFPRIYSEVRSFRALEALATEQPEFANEIDRYVAKVAIDRIPEVDGMDDLHAIIEAGAFREREVDLLISDAPPVLPRFTNGVLFYGVERFFAVIQGYVKEGTKFVFGINLAPGESGDPLVLLKTFTFGVIPTVIFFGALMSVLYYIGIMRWVVMGMAWVMQRLLGTSGAESLAAASNVMVGQTEAPLIVQPFVGQMTRSELNCLMLGGFTTITGSLMAIFASLGISAGHLLAASIISAPAALVIAKILQPETEKPLTMGQVEMPVGNGCVNVIDAAAQGASDGMKLAINVIAMLVAFLALIAFLDSLLYGLGYLIQSVYNSFAGDGGAIELNWSIKGLFAILFYPLAWIMGIQTSDCFKSGEILGTKMVVNEFVAYLDLAEIKSAGPGATVTMSERTQIILTYALCGFSNFASIGIQIGGIGAIAPSRRSDLAQLGLRAMFGGMIACCMTACIAGILYGIDLFAWFR